MRITLEFLMQNGRAIGCANAIPTRLVLRRLAQRRHPMTKETFQQTILNETRGGDVFIGVCARGIYLIQDRNDAVATNDFYSRRIKSELKHRRNLKRLVKTQGWRGRGGCFAGVRPFGLRGEGARVHGCFFSQSF
jgi:hypothetical protein